MVGRQAACLVHGLARSHVERLRVVLHRLLVEGAAGWIHALVARLHRDLIAAVLLLRLVLVVEEAALHRVPVVYHGLYRVILLVCMHQWVYLVLIRLILHDLHLVVRGSEVACVWTLLP